jgi:methionyl-tRNA formyltransferase
MYHMTKDDLKIVFMGTPDFAVASLHALVEGGYHVAGVVTMPDKPMGRHGSTLQMSAVKRYAVSAGLPTLQPERLKDESFLRDLRAMQADLQVALSVRNACLSRKRTTPELCTTH